MLLVCIHRINAYMILKYLQKYTIKVQNGKKTFVKIVRCVYLDPL